MRKKRLIVCICAVLCMLSMSITASAADENEGSVPITQYVTDLFADVSSNQWFAGDVQKAYTFGMMKGVSSYQFAPDAGMNRAMFVQVLYNMQGNPAFSGNGMPFTDVPLGAWYYSAVGWAYSENITEGVSDILFAPNLLVSREQAVKLLYYYTRPAGVFSGNLSKFADRSLVSDWAVESMAWAVDSGVITGSMDNGVLCLRPKDSLVRSEAAAMLSRYYELINGTAENIQLPEEIHITASQIRKGVNIPCLMYHEVSDNLWGMQYLFVSPSKMKNQLEYLKNNGYDTIFFSDLTHLEDFDKPILLTFDDGYSGNYDNLFPLLKEYNMKATIFMATNFIGKPNYLSAAQLREMSDSGLVSVQSHTQNHWKLNQLSDEEILEQYQQSKTAISSVTGKSPYVISYPEGQYSTAAKKLAEMYFSFGVEDRGGRWKTDGNLFSVKRSGVSRDMSIAAFKKILK